MQFVLKHIFLPQTSTPMQSHADLGIDPMDCRVCGRHFTQEGSRARHELDAHQIRSCRSVARNILGVGGNTGSDSDSSIGDSTPLAFVLPSPPQQTLSPIPPSPLSLSPISSVPLSPMSPLPLSPTTSPPPPPGSPPPSGSPPPQSSCSSASSASSSGDRTYTCNVCFCTFTSNRYYRHHLRHCR